MSTANHHHNDAKHQHVVVKEVDIDECLGAAEENLSETKPDFEHAGMLPQDPFWKAVEIFKYVWNCGLVGFSLCVIFYCVSMKYCVFQTHPAVLFILLFAATLLLAYVEALHYANVAVEKWDMTPYKDRFPRACETQKLVKNNKLVQQFLVGRQFFVIFVVFIIAQITTFPHVPHDMWGMPAGFILIIVQVGIPGVMWVLTIGQLVPQLYVEEYTLPFLNLYGCHLVTRVCFAAEFIGICHFSWLLFHSVSGMLFGFVRETTAAPASEHADVAVVEDGKAVELTTANVKKHTPVPTVEGAEVAERRVEYDEISITKSEAEGEKMWYDYVWDAARYGWSTFVTLGSVLIVIVGIWHHYSVLPVPVAALYIIFVFALTLLFYLEGLMICIVATQYWDPETFRESHPRAYAMHKLVNQPENLKRFIIGRQFFTVLTNFLLAQVCVFPDWPSDGYDPVLFFIIIRSGLVGVMITLAFAQLLPELLGARYPLFFMNLIGAYTVVVVSLFIEACGIGHCAWGMYFASRKVLCAAHLEANYKPAVLDNVKAKDMV